MIRHIRKRSKIGLTAMLAAGLLSTATSGEAASMPAPIVFFDIAGPDNAAQAGFYETIFDWKAGPGGTLSVPVHGPSLPGALRADPAAKVIYIGVPDVTATLAAITAAGGKTVMPRFEVKGVAVIGLFDDPAGNTMGLVELTTDGKTKIP
jgi:predicted enzyme related to lactoylglutathione lyase